MPDPRVNQSSLSSFKLYMRLLSYMKRYWLMFGVSMVGYIIFASTQPMLAGLLKYFVDGLADPQAAAVDLPLAGDVHLLYGVPLALLMITVWQGIGSFLGGYYLARVSLGLVQDLRIALFNNLLTLPNRYFDNHATGYLISRITYNVGSVTGAATDALKVMVREGLTVVFLFGYLLWMNWKLTMVMVAILPLIALMVKSASKKFRSQSRKIQSAMGELTHVSSETIQNYRVVRSFGGERYERERFREASEDSTRKQLRMTRTSAIYTPTLQLVNYAAMAFLMFLVLFLLLIGGAAWYGLLGIVWSALFSQQPVQQALSRVFDELGAYLRLKASLFEPVRQLDLEARRLELARQNGRVVTALNLAKEIILNRMSRKRSGQKTNRYLKLYFIAQDIHERASSSHYPYNALAEAFARAQAAKQKQ